MSGHLARNRLVGTIAAALLVGLPLVATAQEAEAPAAEPEAAAPVATTALARIAETGKITFGYLAGAESFSAAGEADVPTGFAIDLCGQIAAAIKADLGRDDLAVDWVEIAPAEGADAADAALQALTAGDVDMLCTAVGETLARRAAVSFSLPVFPGGTGVLLRADSPQVLRDLLVGDEPTSRPIWRGTPARTLLDTRTFAVVPGTIAETWANERVATLNLSSTVMPVDSVDAGVAAVLNRDADALFGQMPQLLDRAQRSADPSGLIVLPRHFTHEPLALPLPRGDEDLRLLVDRTLSAAYRSEGFAQEVTTWFGEPDKSVVTFFQQTALPD